MLKSMRKRITLQFFIDLIDCALVLTQHTNPFFVLYCEKSESFLEHRRHEYKMRGKNISTDHFFLLFTI